MYIKCFSKETYNQVLSNGHKFLYESNGVYYFEQTDENPLNFSDKDIKFANYINL